jgi:hypothetical protein
MNIISGRVVLTKGPVAMYRGGMSGRPLKKLITYDYEILVGFWESRRKKEFSLRPYNIKTETPWIRFHARGGERYERHCRMLEEQGLIERRRLSSGDKFHRLTSAGVALAQQYIRIRDTENERANAKRNR